jgi:hypothetical protein
VVLGVLGVGVLAGAGDGPPAAAETIQEESDPVPLTSTESTQTVSVPRFAEQGTLQQVEVSVAVEGSATVDVTNLTPAAKATTVVMTVDAEASRGGVLDVATTANGTQTQDVAPAATGQFVVDAVGDDPIEITDPAELDAFRGAGGPVEFEVTGVFAVDVQGPAIWRGRGAAAATATVTVTYTFTDLPPTAVADAATVAEDGGTNPIAVLDNDTDSDGGPIAVASVTPPGNGTAAVDAGGTGVTYAPDANFCGADSFTYTLAPGGSTATVSVTVTCVNDPPEVDPATFTVEEEAAVGTVVGTVTFDDVDASQTHTFAITAGDPGGAFAIDPATGAITVAAPLDFETTPTYTLTVTVTDNGSPPLSGSAPITINLTDVNEAPVVDPATFTLAENSVDGTAVGTVTFDDVDAGQTHTFAITAGDPGGVFAIDPATGETTVAAPLDFETTPTYTLTVTVTDNGSPPLSGSAPITINLTDVNEAPVVDPATFTLAENSVDATAVGTATFDDVDAGQTHTFAITAGDPGGAFAIDPATGAITVADGAALDFEATPTYTLTVTVTDNGSPALSGSAPITIDLTDVNEAPTIVAPATVSAVRDTPTAVVGISVADPDAGDIELTLAAANGTLDVDASASAAAVTGDGTDTVVITGAVAEINAILGVTDGVTYLNDTGFGGITDSLQLDVNDLGAPALTASATVTIQFNQPPVAADVTATTNEGTPVAVTLSATDADDDDVTFAIVSGPDNGTLGAVGPSDCTSVANTCTAQITYTPTGDFNGSDQFTYEADDGFSTDTGNASITVNPVNDAPVITLSGSAPSYTENGPAVTVDGGVTVTDVDDTDLESGTVSITAGLVAGDTLTFTPAGGITDTNPAADVLALTGTATVDQWQSVLRSVQYSSTSDNPTNATRTVSLVVSDGELSSNTALKDVAVVPVNDAPVLTQPTAVAVTYTEDSVPVVIAPSITATDVDSTNLVGATIDIGAGYVEGEDVLSLGTNPQNGITAGAFDATTGTLTLTGTSSVANYEGALRDVRFANTSDNPDTTADRTVTFQVDDGAAIDNLSNIVTRDVTVIPVDDAPVITLSGSTPSFTEGGPAVTVDGGLTVTDVDDTNLESGTVSITAGLVAGDTLAFTPAGGITDTNPAPDVLALTGTATVTQWQSVLRSVQYSSTSDNPTNATRTVSFVVNDGTLDSNTAAKSVAVVPVNDAPVLTQPDASAVAYTENAAPVAIAPNITVADVDSTNLVGATITIGTGYINGQDILSLGTNPQNGITAGTFNPATGTLTLTGTSTAANYQAALRDVRYANTSDNPVTAARTISFQVDDGGAVDNLSNTVSRALTVTPVNDPPVAVDDSFAGVAAAVANTRLAVGTATTGPHLATPGSVLSNDTDVDSPASGFTATPATISSANCSNCSNVNLEADGNFTYDPPAGFVGTDTFTYTLNDNDPETPANQTDTATVSIEVVGPVVWYVDIDAAAPTPGQGGRSHSPFNSLAPLTTGGTADGLDGDGNIIFVGVDTTPATGPYDGGLVLETNQRLWGEPFGLLVDPNGVIGPTQLVPAAPGIPVASNPNIRNSAAGGVGITLASGVELQRVNAGVTGAGSATGISGTAIATATIGGNQLVEGNTTGITLSGAAGGNIAVAATVTGNTGTAVNVANRNGGTTTFSGNITGSSANSAITLTSNAGATVEFTGAVNLNSTAAGVTAFSATGGGTITATNAANQVASFAGTSINLNGVTIGAGGMTLNNVSSAAGGATNGITLTNVGGGSFTVNSGSITATTRGLDVDGGAGNVTIGATLTTSGAAARSVEVTNRTGGTVDLNGAVTDTSQGINLSANGTGLVRFDGGVNANTGANTAFNATVSGNVAVTDANGAAAPNNTLTTTTGTALNVVNQTIHSDRLTFQSISANGAPNGIVLDNTGTSAGLTVTGDGGVTNNGSGGTIQNTTGAGITLNNTDGVSVSYLNITNAGADSIRILDINGFVLNRSNISDSAGTAPADKAIDVGDFVTGTPVNGTITLSNDVIGPAAGSSPHDSLAVGISAGTSTWSITGTTFQRTGNSAISWESRGTSVASVNVQNSTFAGANVAGGTGSPSARGIFVNALDDSVITLFTIQGSTFTNNNIHIDMNQQNDTDPVGSHTFSVLNNTMTGARSHAMNIFAAAGSFGGNFTGTVQGNTIGNASVDGSGSEIGNGIRVNMNGGSDAIMLLQNNVIREAPNGRGIEVIGRNGLGSLDVTILNNDVDHTNLTYPIGGGAAAFPLGAIYVNAAKGGATGIVGYTVRADVRQNTVPAAGGPLPAASEVTATYLSFVESVGTETGGILELVDSPPGPGGQTPTQQLQSTNTGDAGANAGVTLIAGPIGTPP